MKNIQNNYVDKLKRRFYKSENHPYKLYEKKIDEVIKNTDTILDAGCGRSAPVLSKYIGRVKFLVGVDLEGIKNNLVGIKFIKADISKMPEVCNESVDVVISRAVLEHVLDPNKVFKETNRILRVGGKFIFLVPNFYDYGSLMSFIIPNRYHRWVVQKTEGRRAENVFPAFYKVNTFTSIDRISRENGFKINEFKYLGQYPNYFNFNSVLFLMGTIYDKVICKFHFLRFLRAWLLVTIEKT